MRNDLTGLTSPAITRPAVFLAAAVNYNISPVLGKPCAAAPKCRLLRNWWKSCAFCNQRAFILQSASGILSFANDRNAVRARRQACPSIFFSKVIKMTDAGLRRFTRVKTNQPVRLFFGEKQYEQRVVNNLSLSGAHIKGYFDQQPQDICTIEAEHSLPDGASVKFRATGAAVRFVSMPHDSLQLLQTMLLYQAEDPLAVGTEFGCDEASFRLEEA